MENVTINCKSNRKPNNLKNNLYLGSGDRLSWHVNAQFRANPNNNQNNEDKRR